MAEETVAGEPVSETQIEVWANEAEHGYPVEQLGVADAPPKEKAQRAWCPSGWTQSCSRHSTSSPQGVDAVSRSEAIRDAVRRYIDVA